MREHLAQFWRRRRCGIGGATRTWYSVETRGVSSLQSQSVCVAVVQRCWRFLFVPRVRSVSLSTGSVLMHDGVGYGVVMLSSRETAVNSGERRTSIVAHSRP